MLKQVGPSTHPHYVEIDEKNGDRLVEEKEVYVTTAKYVTTENHEPLELEAEVDYRIGRVQQFNPLTRIRENIRD